MEPPGLIPREMHPDFYDIVRNDPPTQEEPEEVAEDVAETENEHTQQPFSFDSDTDSEQDAVDVDLDTEAIRCDEKEIDQIRTPPLDPTASVAAPSDETQPTEPRTVPTADALESNDVPLPWLPRPTAGLARAAATAVFAVTSNAAPEPPRRPPRDPIQSAEAPSGRHVISYSILAPPTHDRNATTRDPPVDPSVAFVARTVDSDALGIHHDATALLDTTAAFPTSTRPPLRPVARDSSTLSTGVSSAVRPASEDFSTLDPSSIGTAPPRPMPLSRPVSEDFSTLHLDSTMARTIPPRLPRPVSEDFSTRHLASVGTAPTIFTPHEAFESLEATPPPTPPRLPRSPSGRTPMVTYGPLDRFVPPDDSMSLPVPEHEVEEAPSVAETVVSTAATVAPPQFHSGLRIKAPSPSSSGTTATTEAASMTLVVHDNDVNVNPHTRLAAVPRPVVPLASPLPPAPLYEYRYAAPTRLPQMADAQVQTSSQRLVSLATALESNKPHAPSESTLSMVALGDDAPVTPEVRVPLTPSAGPSHVLTGTTTELNRVDKQRWLRRGKPTVPTEMAPPPEDDETTEYTDATTPGQRGKRWFGLATKRTARS